MTDETVAPLDAYITAKPNEPTFTLQGGDPLAPGLVRVWAHLARMAAGAGNGTVARMAFEAVAAKTTEISLTISNADRHGLLIRATEAEQVSWSMDEYLRGHDFKQQKEIVRVNELDRLDIHDVRRRCAGAISSFFSELNDYREKLIEFGWLSEELDNAIQGEILGLRGILSQIEIRRER